MNSLYSLSMKFSGSSGHAWLPNLTSRVSTGEDLVRKKRIIFRLTMLLCRVFASFSSFSSKI